MILIVLSVNMNKDNLLLKDPLVSIIMSVFNNESDVASSIESILCQTYKNFEFLILDDGSTDSTEKIIRGYKDDRISVFTNSENIGLTKSLNKLIIKASGDYIARQDADDLSKKERIETQIKYIQEKNLDACTTRAIVRNKKRIIPRYSYYFPNKFVMKYKNPFIHGSLLIKRETLNRIDLYNEKFKFAQDYKLFDDLIKANYKIRTIKEPLYYLNTENNISTLKLNEQQYYADCVRKNILPE